MADERWPKPPSGFVKTSIARHLIARLNHAADLRALMVFVGPWGMGKSMASRQFSARNPGRSLLFSVENGARTIGTRPIHFMQQFIRKLRLVAEVDVNKSVPTGFRGCQMTLNWLLTGYFDQFYQYMPFDDKGPKLLIILDEAQFLSRATLDMIRTLADGESIATPHPLGFALIGNDEFDLDPSEKNESQMPGAVHSRALFYEAFTDRDIPDEDFLAIMNTRGLLSAECTALVLEHFNSDGVRRDLRRLDSFLTRLSSYGDLANATPGIIKSILENDYERGF